MSDFFVMLVFKTVIRRLSDSLILNTSQALNSNIMNQTLTVVRNIISVCPNLFTTGVVLVRISRKNGTDCNTASLNSSLCLPAVDRLVFKQVFRYPSGFLISETSTAFLRRLANQCGTLCLTFSYLSADRQVRE